MIHYNSIFPSTFYEKKAEQTYSFAIHYLHFLTLLLKESSLHPEIEQSIIHSLKLLAQLYVYTNLAFLPTTSALQQRISKKIQAFEEQVKNTTVSTASYQACQQYLLVWKTASSHTHVFMETKYAKSSVPWMKNPETRRETH